MSLKSTSGNVAFYPITQGPIELQNKLAQNFPEYVDPVSHKDAESPLRTDWTRLGQSPSWNGRQALLINLMLLMVLNLLIGGLLDKSIIFVQEFMVVQMILIIYSLFPMQIII